MKKAKYVAIGALFGAVAAALLTPKTGKQLRIQTAAAAKKIAGGSDDIIEVIKEFVSNKKMPADIVQPEEEIIISKDYTIKENIENEG
ncbi:MAG: hypothetical protein GT589_01320 [Peptoclostridium sp.]|uniref:YtxH domain-containing protein n=1 Tax=Peptoclostridium sp. TaxID=1904860 RepID=UPI00139E0BBA|nr:YtxH domain-containing protein [Peptoclostridium sp.]MZQ74784.1 hypothetical protein [Peptoclostridium sp.]